jgi:hypothetical protein
MNEPFYITYKLVEEILQKHDVHCVFELDAPMQIFTRLMSAKFYTTQDVPSREAEFRECWALSEIYCPHEGIDRRREYGMETVL